MSKGMTGLKHNKETLKKMSKSHKGLKHTKQSKKKISIGNKGKIISKETREKLRAINIGKKWPKERIGSNRGENGTNWKGGTPGYWMNQARVRDNNTCQKCGIDDTDVLEVDHIIPRIVSSDSSLCNLVTLCANCHLRKTKVDVKVYKNYFYTQPRRCEEIKSNRVQI